MAKLPYMPFYVFDWLTDAKVVALTLEQQGAYFRLLCHQWIEGVLPGDADALRSLCGINANAVHQGKLCGSEIYGAEHFETNIWSQISHFFEKGPDGLRNKKLSKIRQEQTLKADKASKNASKRWRCGRNANAMRSQCHPDADADADADAERREENASRAGEDAASAPLEGSPEKSRKPLNGQGDMYFTLTHAPFNFGDTKARDILTDHPPLETDIEDWLAFENDRGTAAMVSGIKQVRNPKDLPPVKLGKSFQEIEREKEEAAIRKAILDATPERNRR